MTLVFCFVQFTLKPSITDDFTIRVGIKFYNNLVRTICFDNGIVRDSLLCCPPLYPLCLSRMIS